MRVGGVKLAGLDKVRRLTIRVALAARETIRLPPACLHFQLVTSLPVTVSLTSPVLGHGNMHEQFLKELIALEMENDFSGYCIRK